MLASTVFPQHSEAETEDQRTRFNISLKELGELRSQLHHAADYCQSTFLNSSQKRMVIENTKEYLCHSIVTVVDHLGSVSAKLDHQLLKTSSVSDTEMRINNLKQRLSTCQQYSHKLALSKLSWNACFPRHQLRYTMQPIPNLWRSNAFSKESGDATKAKDTKDNQEIDKKDELPFVSYSPLNVSKMSHFILQDNGHVTQPKPQHQLIPFEEKHNKLKRRTRNWKRMENHGLISLFRGTTHEPRDFQTSIATTTKYS